MLIFYRYKAAAVFSVGFLISGFTITIIPSLIPDVMRAFNLTATSAGLLFIAWGAGCIPGAFLGSFFVRNLGPAFSLFFITISTSVALYFSQRADNYYLFVVFIFVISFLLGSFINIGHSVAAAMPQDVRMSVISALDFSVSAGTVLAPLLVNFSFDYMSQDDVTWRNIFLIPVYLLIPLGLIFAFTGDDIFSAFSSSGIARSENINNEKPLINGYFFLFIVSIFLIDSIEYGYSYWSVKYFSEMFSLEASEARSIFASFLFGMMISRLLLTFCLTRRNTALVLVCSTSLIFVCVAYTSEYKSFPSLWIANCLLGIGVGAVFPSTLGLATFRFEGMGHLLSSSALVAGTLGAKGTAALIGFLIDADGIHSVGIVLTSLAFALLVTSLVYVRPRPAGNECERR